MAAPLLIAAAPLVVSTRVAEAQRPSALRVGADNDAFNFWIPPWDRTDHEYTSGVRGSVEYDGPIAWSGWPRWPRMTRRAPSDTARRETRTASRLTHTFSLGQMIFTGNELTQNSLALVAPGYGPRASRPNAAWLYLEAAERDSSDLGMSELSLAIGIVGSPALGSQMQNLFHSLGQEYQRPSDWSRQLPFEPGFVARYAKVVPLLSFGDGERRRSQLSANGGAAVGTIQTSLSVGAEATTDMALGSIGQSALTPRIAFTLGGGMDVVLRDEFLDGTLFRASDRVSKNALVGHAHAAITFRWRQIGVTYRANRVGPQYAGQARPTTWSSIETEWRLSR